MKSLSDENNRVYMSLKHAVAEIAHRIDLALPDLNATEPIRKLL